ncbi:chromate transporter [Proteiniclasticum ruminis]|uniref:Chromate transporter n=1 Tax=Proteiniclasticum ruminis TaxID=398199 RepID=A0A1G8IDI8_9CLOT|nr:chromate transporter [Proteiniclasticum ruminis]SDI16867.1 chromate transporter [Proteiniclasticum ruminis]
MVLLELYFVFLQIGAFAFGGGYAVLPLIQRFVVEERGWMSIKEMTDLVSLSQMTPGPIAINSATFVGTKVAGVPGAIVATLANVTPQFILMMILAYFIFRDKKIGFLDKMLKGLKPGIVGLIAIAAISMMESSLFEGAVSVSNISVVAVAAFIIGFFLKLSKRFDLIVLIVIGAFIGIGGNLLLQLFS